MAVCPGCGESFKGLGAHWSQSDCPYPMLSKKQHEIVTGVLMGDGWIDGRNVGNPILRCGMITRDYLEHLDEVFGVLGTGVRFDISAEESARQARNSGFRPSARTENYSDKYRWRTRSHPELNQYADWYSSGKKVFPKDIELTPTVLKHWYCGDGTFRDDSTNHHITISMNNERDNKTKIERYFREGPGVGVGRWDESELPERGNRCSATFSRPASERLWEYMGDPLPGFEYKWPEEYRQT